MIPDSSGMGSRRQWRKCFSRPFALWCMTVLYYFLSALIGISGYCKTDFLAPPASCICIYEIVANVTCSSADCKGIFCANGWIDVSWRRCAPVLADSGIMRLSTCNISQILSIPYPRDTLRLKHEFFDPRREDLCTNNAKVWSFGSDP